MTYLNLTLSCITLATHCVAQYVAYARVSSHDQKADLERQKQVLELYCAQQGWTFEVIADLGSGMNYHKKGLKRLLNEGVAKLALEAKFDDFCAGSVSRKLTYPIGHRRLARNPNPAQKGQIWPQMEFCNSL